MGREGEQDEEEVFHWSGTCLVLRGKIGFFVGGSVCGPYEGWIELDMV